MWWLIILSPVIIVGILITIASVVDAMRGDRKIIIMLGKDREHD